MTSQLKLSSRTYNGHIVIVLHYISNVLTFNSNLLPIINNLLPSISNLLPRNNTFRIISITP